MQTRFQLDHCVKILENIKPEAGDIIENAAICLLDLDDVLKAKSYREFKKEKKDCKRTFKQFYKQFRNLDYFKIHR